MSTPNDAYTQRIAVICASNQNRSMETHHLFVEKGVPNVWSFGTGSQVKLPGPSKDKPNVYEFGVPYSLIYEDLSSKDPALYDRLGLLKMLQRNMTVKDHPQRFQDEPMLQFDIIFTFENRVFDLVVDGANLIPIRPKDLRSRGSTSQRPVHVINFQTPDTRQDAAEGALGAYNLYSIIHSKGDRWSDEVDTSIAEYLEDLTRQKLPERSIFHEICFY